MGWDAEQAEDQYWEARASGLSDADILRMDVEEGPKIVRTTEKKTAAQLRSLIEEAQNLLNKMENLPEEPEQDLVIFEVKFNGYGRTYTYAALRVIGKWYVTGVSGLSNVEWHEIFDFFEGKQVVIQKIEPCVRLSDVRDFI